MQKNNRPNGLLFFFVLVGLVNLVVLVVLVISSSAILVTPLYRETLFLLKSEQVL